MRIFVEHDARALAMITGSDPPGCDGVIVRIGDPSDVLAHTIRSNPLDGTWLLDLDSPGTRVVTWSGTLAPELFEAHPATWLTPGHDALHRFCDELAPQLHEHGRILCLQPHSRHVLSDAQSCRRFLDEREGQPFEIALAPAMLLEASMLGQVEDHLARTFETLALRSSMVVLSDVASDGEGVVTPPLGSGELPRSLVLELMDRHLDPAVPIVIQPGAIQQQLEWLAPLVDCGH